MVDDYPHRSWETPSAPETADVGCLHVMPRWGAVMAGVFVTLALLVLFAEAGAALGLSLAGEERSAVSYLVGAGAWGIVTTLVSFLAGGFAANWITRHADRTCALVHGALVWAVTVPLIGVLGAILATTAIAAGSGAAAVAAAEPGEVVTAPASEQRVERVAEAAAAVGWAMVGAIVLALVAALLGGVIGVRRHATARLRRSP